MSYALADMADLGTLHRMWASYSDAGATADAARLAVDAFAELVDEAAECRPDPTWIAAALNDAAVLLWPMLGATAEVPRVILRNDDQIMAHVGAQFDQLDDVVEFSAEAMALYGLLSCHRPGPAGELRCPACLTGAKDRLSGLLARPIGALLLHELVHAAMPHESRPYDSAVDGPLTGISETGLWVVRQALLTGVATRGQAVALRLTANYSRLECLTEAVTEAIARRLWNSAAAALPADLATALTTDIEVEAYPTWRDFDRLFPGLSLNGLLDLDTTWPDFTEPFAPELGAERYALITAWLEGRDVGWTGDDESLVSARGWDAVSDWLHPVAGSGAQ